MKTTLSYQPVQPSTPPWARWSLILNAVVFAAVLQVAMRSVMPLSSPSHLPVQPALPECQPPLPSFLAATPPSGTEEPLQNALGQLDSLLQHEFDQGGMDSLSVAVVASEGPLYEGFWGRLRANESDTENSTVDRHSVYRLASISKLFTAIETFILRDRGFLRLDDPISSVCPEFRYNKYYSPITWRALMSHMSGIGRDWPPGDARGHWPKSLFGWGPPSYNGLGFPSHQEVFDAVARNHPVAAPYTYPVYSNTGYSLLGMANVAANIAANGPFAPTTHAELVQKDIFGPLGFNETSFLVTEDNVHNVVVPSVNPSEIDENFQDTMNPSGGQMSSLSDLTKLMQVLINPRRPESILSPSTIREWMRPMHTWFDGYSAVGALWEIYTSTDSYGRKQQLYQKTGELAGYHSTFTVNLDNSYGIIVLQSGPVSEAIRLTKLITSTIQVAFDRVLEDITRRNLVGTWRSKDSLVSLTTEIHFGSLYVNEYTINGTDVLQVMQEGGPDPPSRMPLWSMGDNEYRLVVPTSGEGCLYSWVMMDMYGYINGASVTVMVSKTDDHGEPVLFLPAINAELRR